MIGTNLSHVRRLRLALVISSIFGAAASDTACAATLSVTDCSDGPSSGTLRNTIAAAPDNSIIQIPLMCSKITLSGHIEIGYFTTNMYIVGQGPSATIIDGGSTSTPAIHDRVFSSAHLGTLGFSQLTITHGNPINGNPNGGCVYAAIGSVGFNHAVVTGCERSSTDSSSPSKGGGVFAEGSVSLLDSTVTDNVADAAPSQTSLGGGIYAKKGVNASNSTIARNAAQSGSGGPSRGGGFYAVGGGNSVINRSTISNNYADINSALQIVDSGAGNFTVSITSSTIANNDAQDERTVSTELATTVTNSTVAFNHVNISDSTEPAGLYSTKPIEMDNSIFANNTADAGTPNDVHSTFPFPLSGSNNLITSSSDPTPPGTLSSCPRLGHLSSNGGLTQTIPLLKGSPAIDTGAANGQTTDQRGTGFARTVGSGTDIGAYERQAGVVDDVIFFGQFESRCD